jgi:hypothetical protein
VEIEPVSKVMPPAFASKPQVVAGSYVWAALASRLLHPVKLVILEALLWVEEPMSATGLAAMLEDPDYYHGLLSYHVAEMAKTGVVVLAGSRTVRGAEELFFYFPPEREGSGSSTAGAGATR